MSECLLLRDFSHELDAPVVFVRVELLLGNLVVVILDHALQVLPLVKCSLVAMESGLDLLDREADAFDVVAHGLLEVFLQTRVLFVTPPVNILCARVAPVVPERVRVVTEQLSVLVKVELHFSCLHEVHGPWINGHNALDLLPHRDNQLLVKFFLLVILLVGGEQEEMTPCPCGGLLCCLLALVYRVRRVGI